jgi:hypothetical protein
LIISALLSKQWQFIYFSFINQLVCHYMRMRSMVCQLTVLPSSNGFESYQQFTLCITSTVFNYKVVLLRRRYSLETIVEYCLQALLSHSTLESHCKKMMTTPMLPLFVKIIQVSMLKHFFSSLLTLFGNQLNLHHKQINVVIPWRSGLVCLS